GRPPPRSRREWAVLAPLEGRRGRTDRDHGDDQRRNISEVRIATGTGHPQNETRVTFELIPNLSLLGHGFLIGLKNKYHGHQPSGYSPLEDVPEVHLVEAYPTGFQRALHDLYTKAVQQGRRKEALGIIADVFPGVSNVEILTEHGEPIL